MVTKSVHQSYLFVTVQKTIYNKAKIVNMHGNWLPQKPTTHQAGCPHNSFLIKHE